MRTKFPLKICLVPCECSLKCLFRISETYRTIKTNQSEDRLWNLRKKPHTSKATSNIKHHNKLIERETLHQTALLIIFSCLLSLSLQQCNKWIYKQGQLLAIAQLAEKIFVLFQHASTLKSVSKIPHNQHPKPIPLTFFRHKIFPTIRFIHYPLNTPKN